MRSRRAGGLTHSPPDLNPGARPSRNPRPAPATLFYTFSSFYPFYPLHPLPPVPLNPPPPSGGCGAARATLGTRPLPARAARRAANPNTLTLSLTLNPDPDPDPDLNPNPNPNPSPNRCLLELPGVQNAVGERMPLSIDAEACGRWMPVEYRMCAPYP